MGHQVRISITVSKPVTKGCSRGSDELPVLASFLLALLQKSKFHLTLVHTIYIAS